MKADAVSSELRQIERDEIDAAPAALKLLGRSRTPAAFYLLLACEDVGVKCYAAGAQYGHPTWLGAGGALQFALKWVSKHCPAGGEVPREYDRELHSEAAAALLLAREYKPYYDAFFLASKGRVRLRLEEAHINVEPVEGFDQRYYVYNVKQRAPLILSPPDIEAVRHELEGATTVDGPMFEVTVTEQLMKVLLGIAHDRYDQIRSLPPRWEFSRYTLSDYRDVTSVLWSLATAQFFGRSVAIAKGATLKGWQSAMLLTTQEALTESIHTWTGVGRSQARATLEDLTYGSRDIRDPDPSLQPLVPLGDILALPPFIVMTLDFERNLSVLLQRMPEERRIYDGLKDQKEEGMRISIADALGPRFSVFKRKVSLAGVSVPLDLVVVDRATKAVLVGELKWFNAPGEPREEVQKDKEIARGIQQLTSVATMETTSHEALCGALGVALDFQVGFAVISATWIGSGVENHDLPVVLASDLVEHSKRNGLKSTLSWLKARTFLPVEGKDFIKTRRTFQLGTRRLIWGAFRLAE